MKTIQQRIKWFNTIEEREKFKKKNNYQFFENVFSKMIKKLTISLPLHNEQI